MAVTRKAEYAISALAYLAARANCEFVSSREIAKRKGIPPNFIAQILATMSKAGWLEGARGPSGGMRLKRDPSTITLKEVIELFDGPFGISRCLVKEGECLNQGNCPLQGIWAEAQSRMLEVLEGKTIQDLVHAERIMREKGRD